MRIQRAGQLGVNPASGIGLALLGQVLLDLQPLGVVDMTVGPGRGHHGAHQQAGSGIQFGARQLVEGMGRAGRWRTLVLLPVLIELVGQPAEGRRPAHRRHLGAVLAHLLVAKQQRHGPGGQPPLGHALHLGLARVTAIVEPALASSHQLLQHLFHGASSFA
ncbi:hypothetical protein D3C75_639070 [compost metagenome]